MQKLLLTKKLEKMLELKTIKVHKDNAPVNLRRYLYDTGKRVNKKFQYRTILDTYYITRIK